MKKKLNICSELSRFHYVGQNYINLVAYLNCECESFMIDAIADTLAAVTKYTYWHNFEAICVSPDALKLEIASELAETTEDFCKFSQRIPENFFDAFMAEVWFNTMLLYYEFSSDVPEFLRKVSEVVVRNKDVFSENAIEQFFALMLAEGMSSDVEQLGSALNYMIVHVSPEDLEQFQNQTNSFAKYMKDYFSLLNGDNCPELLN